MEAGLNISYAVSFIAGFLLFFSPCILPLIPSYISYLTGISFKELSGELNVAGGKQIRTFTVIHSLLFILGFSIIFVMLGMTVTFMGRFLLEYQLILKKAGAILIIFFGFVIAGVFKIGILQREKKIAYRKKGISYLGSLLVGVTFALAWTPCVGPVLGSILIYASSTANIRLGFRLLSIFSLGLAIPFFVSSLLVNSFLLYFKKIKNYMKWVNIIAGIILVIFGIIILCGNVHAQQPTYEKAIDFRLDDINGNAVRLSDYSGKVIILNFFATWCPPCRVEIPDFNEISAEYENEVEIIAINIGRESISKVKDFAKRYNLRFIIAMDDGEVSRLYGPIRAIPVTFIIDKNFGIARKYIGSRSKEVFVRDIKELDGN